MPIPNYPAKYGAEAVVTPEEHADHHGTAGSAPEAVVLTYQSDLYRWVQSERGDETPPSYPTTGGLVPLAGSDGRIAVAGDFGIGAPATAGVVEALVANGTEAFVVLGGCGGLGPLDGTGVVVTDRAVRDEGVSHHYLPDARYVDASAALVGRLEAALDDCGVDYAVGASWTTSAFFRETVPEVEHYADEGVLTAEMEAAALFAIAEYRGVDAAALLVPFDRLGVDDWVPPEDDAVQGLRDLYGPVRDALASHLR